MKGETCKREWKTTKNPHTYAHEQYESIEFGGEEWYSINRCFFVAVTVVAVGTVKVSKTTAHVSEKPICCKNMSKYIEMKK